MELGISICLRQTPIINRRFFSGELPYSELKNLYKTLKAKKLDFFCYTFT
jgi:hypothetical protein